jgi:PAS domain S-box-containing protein
MMGRSLGALVEPACAVARGDDRRDARLLATVLIAIVCLGTGSAFAQLAFVPGFFPSFCVIVAAMAVLLAAYALSRTVHFRLGAAIAVMVCILACFATLASNPTDATAPAFMVIPVLVASTFLPLRAAAVMAMSSALGLVAFGALNPAIDPHVLWAGGAFFVIISSLLLVLARHRTLVERDRHAAVAESEARYRALFRATFDGLMVLHDGIIVEVNDASARIFGRSPDALEDTSLVALFDAESRTAVQALLEGGDGASSEIGGRKSDGTPFVVELVVKRTRHRNASATVVGIRDLSEKKQVEAHMRLVGRLSALGTLTAGVAHEINNPLTYSIFTLDALEDGLASSGDAETSEALSDLRHGLTRIEEIVRTLRALARPDEDSITPVDVITTMESSLRIAEVQLRSRATLVRDFRHVPAVLGNTAKLGQVFLNLLINAVQALPERPSEQNKIVVRIAVTEQNEVEVSVGDSGVGIAPDVMARIFDSFFTTKPVGVGTGLGLSICHGIVTSFGGRIAVDSQLGVGTTFRVLLPSAPTVSAAAARGASIFGDARR